MSLAAAAVAALTLAGGALAENHPHRSFVEGHRTSLVPMLDPHPRIWLKSLENFPRNPKPLHRHGIGHAARHAVGHAARQHVRVPKLATTLSIYEQSTRPWELARQGCDAARRHESGVVVLDFGKPAYERGGYGTILFSGRFAKNRSITYAMLGYAKGYTSCLPSGSTASVALSRGTSNYHPGVPSAYVAGVRWGRETNALDVLLHSHFLSRHVTSAAADDAEPAWDPHFGNTRRFIHGYRMAAHGHPMYDYGSLDGGVGSIWSAKQAFFVAGGVRGTKALPEIYNSAMAREWAELARIARARYHRSVRFAGVMTQGTTHCNCGLRPHEAHHALVRALASEGVRNVSLPTGGTNIVG